MDMKKVKIEFAPGCFDSFEGTQEELNELVAEVHQMFADGTFLEKSRPLDLDNLLESTDPEDQELAEKLLRSFSDQPKNNLQ